MAALDNITIAPDRNAAQTLGRGKEFPIAHGLAERRIGDVVGRQGEVVDLDQDFAVVERGQGRGLPLALAQIFARHHEVEAGNGHLRTA